MTSDQDWLSLVGLGLGLSWLTAVELDEGELWPVIITVYDKLMLYFDTVMF